MGAQTDVTAADLRWLSPLPLWTGILSGPIAWAFDLMASYAVVKPVCRARPCRAAPDHSLSLFMVLGGTAFSWAALQRTASDVPIDGGGSRQRARFMAILGLTSCALFTLQILAGAIPQWVIDACQ